MAVNDGYDAHYGDKIWTLIPAVYRAEDSDILDVDGPLREIANRIGVQAAIVRRSIDRLWEDQSIETCDDWVIPYIGELLATNLVPSLDGPGRRVDVAKTIRYRRRSGTVAILEEIAHDITRWEVRVVELFRRLARSRHLLDPQVGLISLDLPPSGDTLFQRAQKLVGEFTAAPLGGLADLRNAYGAAKTDSAFDEFAHTADFRLGRGRTGWYEIQKLGVFVWRLRSFGVELATPVRCGTGDLYTFDPTGRMLPLFARASRASQASYGDAWVAAQEWQLPGPITPGLYEKERANLYPDDPNATTRSLQVFHKPGSFYDPIDSSAVAVHPHLGTFKITPPIHPEPVAVTYYYGFSSEIGAGPYDRLRVTGASPTTSVPTIVHGGGNLDPGTSGTCTIADSLTYATVISLVALTSGGQLTIRSANGQRPLVRLGEDWIFQGDGGSLYFDGVFLSGADLVLRGRFDHVRLACCTLDPGNLSTAPASTTFLAESVDGRALAPSRLMIDGDVRLLEVDHSILGPVRTRIPDPAITGSGAVETLTVTDSILQGIRTSAPGNFAASDVKDPVRLFGRLHDHHDALSTFVWGALSAATQLLVSDYLNNAGLAQPLAAVTAAVVAGLNQLIQGGASIFDPNRFMFVHLDPETQALAAAPPPGTDYVRLNRILLEEGYPSELADLAMAITTGEADLARCTVLGGAYLHRMSASECILDDLFVTEDTQHGCVRFSAWCAGSSLPRQYESVEVAPRAPIFTSRQFGDPGYAQVRNNADAAIVSGGPRQSIYEGGPNGSEMGAFAREMNAIRERSLLIKYQEFMPLGLTPVVIDVT
jgi:hypothetical protein